MDLNSLQVVALLCEALALSLAVIHVFRASLVNLMHQKVQMFTGVKFAQASFGLHSSLDARSPDEEKEIGFNNEMISITGFILTIPIFIWIVDFGDHPLWWIAEILAAGIVAMSAAFITRLVLVVLVQVLFGLATAAGKGNAVIGLGTVLAVLGIGFETVQVWLGPYWWFAPLVWGLVGLFGAAYAYIARRKTLTN